MNQDFLNKLIPFTNKFINYHTYNKGIKVNFHPTIYFIHCSSMDSNSVVLCQCSVGWLCVVPVSL